MCHTHMGIPQSESAYAALNDALVQMFCDMYHIHVVCLQSESTHAALAFEYCKTSYDIHMGIPQCESTCVALGCVFV